MSHFTYHPGSSGGGCGEFRRTIEMYNPVHVSSCWWFSLLYFICLYIVFIKNSIFYFFRLPYLSFLPDHFFLLFYILYYWFWSFRRKFLEDLTIPTLSYAKFMVVWVLFSPLKWSKSVRILGPHVSVYAVKSSRFKWFS